MEPFDEARERLRAWHAPLPARAAITRHTGEAFDATGAEIEAMLIGLVVYADETGDEAARSLCRRILGGMP